MLQLPYLDMLPQVTLATLSSILQEAQLLGQAGPCARILHILDPATLILLLSTAFINNTEAAYGSRSAALQLLTCLISCIRTTWETGSVSQAGSEWDGAVVGCLGGVVRYVCMPNHDTRLGGFKGKHLLRVALGCLLELVRAVPVGLWSEAWQQVGTSSPLPTHCLSFAIKLQSLWFDMCQKQVRDEAASPCCCCCCLWKAVLHCALLLTAAVVRSCWQACCVVCVQS